MYHGGLNAAPCSSVWTVLGSMVHINTHLLITIARSPPPLYTVFTRAGYEPSRSLKFHNHREGPSPIHLKDTSKRHNANQHVE